MNSNDRFLRRQRSNDMPIEPIKVQSGWQRLAQPMEQAVQSGAPREVEDAAATVGQMVQEDAMTEIRDRLLRGEPLSQQQMQLIQQKMRGPGVQFNNAPEPTATPDLLEESPQDAFARQMEEKMNAISNKFKENQKKGGLGDLEKVIKGRVSGTGDAQ